MNRQFDDPFFGSASPFGHSPFGHSSLFGQMGIRPFGALPSLVNSDHLLGLGSSFPEGSHFQSSQTFISSGSGRNDGWVSQSRMTRSVNGVTESVWKRKDANVSTQNSLSKDSPAHISTDLSVGQ